MIYLDNAATTKMSIKALEEYSKYACSLFYNPSATYVQAVDTAATLTDARGRIKKLLGVKNGDIIFTSGATESNNLAIRGSLRQGNWKYIFSSGEHASVGSLAAALKNEGKEVEFVPLQKSGEIDYLQFEKLLSSKTRLVSIMMISNVTGAINDIARISKMVRKNCPQAVLHVDGVQAFCKIPVNLDKLDVDLFSFSAHKFHGPKGVGGLYVRNKAALKNLVYGGGQEFAIRSGTENVGGIMAMLTAAEEIDVEANFKKVALLKQAFLNKLLPCNGVTVAGENTSPYICMLLFKGVNSETLVRSIENEVIVGRGSACSAKKAGNHVLEGMGYNLDLIKGALRVSFDASLSEQEVENAAEIIKDKYLELFEKLK